MGNSPGKDIFMRLTSREMEVLSWIKKGKTSSQISSIMDISQNTVNFHIKNIFNKLGAENRSQVVALAYEKDLQERDLALRAMNHRVMNNFMMLSSLLKLKCHDVQDSEAAAVLMGLSLQINGLASFYRAMIPAGDCPCVSARLFIGKALDDFSRSFVGLGSGVAIKHEIEDIRIKKDIALTCLQIISELISNSINHFPLKNEDLKIRVSLFQSDRDTGAKGKSIRVEVEDNGKGIPDDLHVAGGEPHGMRIITALASQIGGTIKTCPQTNSCLSLSFTDKEQCSH